MANKEKEMLDTISHPGNGSQDHSKVHFISIKMFIIKKTEKSKWSSICGEAEILRPCWEERAMSVGWNCRKFPVSLL